MATSITVWALFDDEYEQSARELARIIEDNWPISDVDVLTLDDDHTYGYIGKHRKLLQAG